MYSVKAARGHYAGKIWDEKADIQSLLLNATQLENSYFSEKHILEMRKISKELNKVVTKQIPTINRQGHLLRRCIMSNKHIKLKEYIELFNFDVNTYIHCRGRYGESSELLLFVALYSRASTDIFRLLINKSTNVYQPATPTHIQTEIIQLFLINNIPNRYEILKLFVESGCWDINRGLGTSKGSPLHVAVHNCLPEMVQFLMENGADKHYKSSVDTNSPDTKSPLEIVKYKLERLSKNKDSYYNALKQMLEYMGEKVE
jgi:hypothetical protein